MDRTDIIKKQLLDDFVTKPSEMLFGQTGSQNIDIDTYRSKFLGSNARSYLFIYNVNFPGMQNVLTSGVQGALSTGGFNVIGGLTSAANTAIKTAGNSLGTQDFRYYVKSTSLPESSVEETNSYWAGQQIKMSGVRRTSDWQVTFLVDHKADVLQKFWDWSLLLHNPESNMYGNPKEYMADQTVQLLGLDGYPISTYKLFGAWPKTIGNVSLDYTNNEFATVDISFAYQYHTVVKGGGEAGVMTIGRNISSNVIKAFL